AARAGAGEAGEPREPALRARGADRAAGAEAGPRGARERREPGVAPRARGVPAPRLLVAGEVDEVRVLRARRARGGVDDLDLPRRRHVVPARRQVAPAAREDRVEAVLVAPPHVRAVVAEVAEDAPRHVVGAPAREVHGEDARVEVARLGREAQLA